MSAYVGIAPSAAYRSIRSGRIPSEAKKIAFDVSGALSLAVWAVPGNANNAALARTRTAVDALKIGLRLMPHLLRSASA